MKRFRLILLSLALVMALCASAFAVDVKFSGSYYAAGMYLDKTTLNKNTDLTGAAPGPSTAFLLSASAPADGFYGITRPQTGYPRKHHGKILGSRKISPWHNC